MVRQTDHPMKWRLPKVLRVGVKQQAAIRNSALDPRIAIWRSSDTAQVSVDFTIINPYTLQKQGFEFSPGQHMGTYPGQRKKSKEINLEARANFEKRCRSTKNITESLIFLL